MMKLCVPARCSSRLYLSPARLRCLSPRVHRYRFLVRLFRKRLTDALRVGPHSSQLLMTSSSFSSHSRLFSSRPSRSHMQVFFSSPAKEILGQSPKQKELLKTLSSVSSSPSRPGSSWMQLCRCCIIRAIQHGEPGRRSFMAMPMRCVLFKKVHCKLLIKRI